MSSPPTEHTTINGIHTTHTIHGEGEPVLLLHGWGANITLLWPLIEQLAQKGFRCHAPDLPGFGGTGLPPATWSVHDYVAFVLAYIDAQQLACAHLFGHSFGGRLSIVLGAKHADRVNKIVLCDAAGVRGKTPWYRQLPVTLYRAVEDKVDDESAPGRLINRVRDAYVKRTGSSDYLDAGELKETLVEVVSEDLLPFAPQITAPTLLVWGANDEDTPLWQAKALEAAIPDAGLVVFPNAGHYAYLDALPDTVRVIDYFYKHDE
ncbi:MAG: alpha/beta hydrolase [Chloroflexota bacterium]